jgi:hypothetical protein
MKNTFTASNSNSSACHSQLNSMVSSDTQKVGQKSKKNSRFSLVLKSLAFVLLFSASFNVLGQTCGMANCFATPTWKKGTTYKKGKEVKIKISGKSKIYKAVYETIAPLTDANNRCENTSGSCEKYWQRVCDCPSGVERIKTGEMGSFSEENEIELSDNLAYPNPFTSNLNVSASVKATSAEVSILNLMGERLLTNNVTAENGKVNTSFDTANLANGMYILQITAGEEVITYKICK